MLQLSALLPPLSEIPAVVSHRGCSHDLERVPIRHQMVIVDRASPSSVIGGTHTRILLQDFLHSSMTSAGTTLK
eukprot:scaffold1848_cov132-Skeletonema_menzelii.AAC.10